MYLMWMLHAAAVDQAVHAQTIDKRLNLCRVHCALDMYNCLRDDVERFAAPVYYRYLFRFVEIVDLSLG